MDDFLWSALETPAIQAFDHQNTFLDSNPYKLSFIRGMEFRTESNQLDPDRQDYALRLNPANPWEIKRNNQYFQTYQEVSQLDRQRELKKVLKAHYEAIIDWAYLKEQKNIKEEEQKIAQTQIKILEAQRFSNFFDANDYVELKIDQLEQVVALEELYFEEDAQRNKIESLYPSAKNQIIAWTLNELISIEKIQSVIEDPQMVSAYGEVAYRQKQVELAESEWALEKSNINIGYLQAQYQQYRVDQDRSPWSIGLGVTIPIFNPNKGDMTKRKLEMIEAEGNLADAQNEQQTGLELMKQKIKTLTTRYYNFQIQLDSLNVDLLSSNLQQMTNSNPMTVVKLKSSLIKSKSISALMKKEIYLAYMEYLWHAEMLQQQPLKNYLTPD
ncbi:hypothetical protein N6H18_14690 [Reichenbachiella agarivorans]|uniref:Outer membrane protein TolC n=1 Tax=Reichenbachiella agarivorans TaxID=2979464 RepID=A0ABY6CM49_9BACT|nr:hypothetical protein [Reichenbachiella agarivorans]UXP31597.1 hypothetical protein N6H18_14690 [Reichenbachiella agarivorans]